MTKFKAKVTLLFDEHKGLSIEIVDGASGVRIVGIDVSVPHAVALLSRRAMVDAEATLYHEMHAPIGYQTEIKVHKINFSTAKDRAYDSPITPKERALIAPFLVDGWDCSKGSSADWRNHHRCVKDHIYNVTFRRWVHPETKKPFIASIESR